MSSRSRARLQGLATADVTIRRARPDDLAAINAIECDAFSDPWPASAFREALAAEPLHFAVAVDAHGAVVGYLVGWFAGGDGEIANIAVAAEARGQGIGGRILDAALETARTAGSETVHLEVRASNGPAQALYASRGFEPVGRRRAYYRDPVEDAIVLRCSFMRDS
ncbi:MAG TPA: ribosomal protein S18-alanine N-acetyltransferase [Gemmatimonadaceae bacterium]|nr:ribosomal protein S18-alanine N-acetyltransferase [Gemmatimonadaceae bacterium]